MTSVRNGAESGTADGTTVTAANSGGGVDNAFDTVTIGASETLTFDSTQVAHDSHAYKYVPTNANRQTYVQWAAAIGAQSRIYGRVYIWAASFPVAAWTIFTALSGATQCCAIRMTTSGKLSILNTSSTNLANSTNAITLSAWNRIEFDFTFSTTVGQYIIKLFSGDSTTAVETMTGTSNHNFGASTADTFRFINVILSNQGSTARTFYFDDLNLNTTGLPGPPLQTVSVSGSVTAAGTVQRGIAKVSGGSVTASGALQRTMAKVLAGSCTPVGVLTRALAKPLSGSVTSAGVLVRTTGKALAGSVTASGTLSRAIARALSGTVTPSGLLNRAMARLLAGSVTPAGTVAKTAGKPVAGSVTPSGVISERTIGKSVTGSVTPTGIVGRSIARSLTGSVTATGSLVRAVAKQLTGTVTPSGLLTKLVGKRLAGTVTAIGNAIVAILRLSVFRSGHEPITAAHGHDPTVVSRGHRPTTIVTGTRPPTSHSGHAAITEQVGG